MKPFLSKTQYYKVNPEIPQLAFYYLRENKYTLHDGFIGYNNNPTGVFYSVEQHKDLNYDDHRKAVFYANFYKDSIVDEYERSVLTFLDVTGTIGGVFQILIIICHVFLLFITGTIFNREISKNRDVGEGELYMYVVYPTKTGKDNQVVPINDLEPGNRNDEESKEPISNRYRLEDSMQLNQNNPELEVPIDDTALKQEMSRLRSEI